MANDKIKETGKQIKTHFDSVKADPESCPKCSKPAQFQMVDKKTNEMKDLSKVKNPDVWCTLCSWCGPRCMVNIFILVMFLPGIFATKYTCFVYVCGIICLCLVLTLTIMVIKICMPNIVEVNTPSMRRIILEVVQMKKDDKSKENALKGMDEKAAFMIKKGCGWFVMLLKGVFCCQICRPSRIFTLGKVLISMIFTEIFMSVSIWMYITGRFMLGAVTWRLFSVVGWVEELMISLALKGRMNFFDYSVFAGAVGGDAGAEGPDGEAPDCCLVACCPCCKDCCPPPCCACGCCSFCCDFCQPFCCTFCELALDLFGDCLSVILLLGKALEYTDRLMKAHGEAGGPKANAVGNASQV